MGIKQVTVQNVGKDGEPEGRLNKIGQRALAAIDDEENVRAMVFIVDNAAGKGAIALAGYDDPDGMELATKDALRHLEAVLSAQGLELAVRVVPGPPGPRGQG